eukprot:TRINITY_DN1803_c0_g1_i10.p1 TRINITY_DN1803_c0_g1~~TRINITY_DN1803_c0_g1_i10.p1  ORF type:complete len:172 (+),score=45.59 TRINITY_DN1803_c0_g1_i10:157-672(+)
MSESEDNKHWTPMNFFSGSSTPTSAEAPPSAASAGFAQGLFNAVKNKFVGAKETVAASASNVYQRDYKLFGITFAFGVAFIIVSFFFLPFIVVAPYKFSAFFTLGSVCILVSFAFLQDPWNYLRAQFAGTRLVFTVCYLLSLLLSLYASVFAKNYLLTLVVTCAQVRCCAP